DSAPGVYSTDLGTGRCVDFTVPNRAIEEYSFFSVGRTTEPYIRGLTVGGGEAPPAPPSRTNAIVSADGFVVAPERALRRAIVPMENAAPDQPVAMAYAATAAPATEYRRESALVNAGLEARLA